MICGPFPPSRIAHQESGNLLQVNPAEMYSPLTHRTLLRPASKPGDQLRHTARSIFVKPSLSSRAGVAPGISPHP